MKIEYKDATNFDLTELKALFFSANWESGKNAKKLKLSLENSDSVYTAWVDNKLVGLINAISDKNMNVFFPYLIVLPDFQRKGIGKKLLKLMMHKYKNIRKKILISSDEKIEFYKKLGFKAIKEGTGMSFENIE